ncbi:MAG TPA: hypothetical protein VF137_05345 [Candidatus Dormibacteraeota bacterium]
MRWRIIALQGVLVIVLGFVTGFLFWGASFANNTVRDQLAAQHIVFPPTAVLAAPEYPAEIHAYAGQQVLNGDQARVYANDFIGVHLNAMKPYNTYAAASTAAMANPKDASLQTLVNTLFKGTMLRSSLLNAYGWWTVGQYVSYAAIGLLIASLAVFGALVFELAQLRKPALEKAIAVKPAYAPTA